VYDTTGALTCELALTRRNEKEAKKHEIIVPNVYVRIYPSGDVLYSIR
jgi:hypothetical protein